MIAERAPGLRLSVPDPAAVASMTLGEAAIAWAACGWSVFPIVPRGKTPYSAGDFCGREDDHACGFHCATTDANAISAWWSEHPDSNIGLTSASAVVVDEDKLGAVAEAGVKLPRCPWARTGRLDGGRHFFLLAPEGWGGLAGSGAKVTYRVPGVEVKGFGKGYVVGAPSLHASGNRYALELGGFVPEAPLAVLDALTHVERVVVPFAGEPVLTVGYVLPASVSSGNRYKAIASYTAHLYNRGFSREEMWAQVKANLVPKFDEVLSERELRDRFGRATKDMEKGLGERRAVVEQRTPTVLEDAPLTEWDATPVEWLWASWLPRGVVTLMDGNPGVSKSTLVADLVARVTTCRPWPDGSPVAGVGRVLWITTEDDPGRVLRPRIEAAGGDASLVRFMKSEVVFPDVSDAFQELLVRRASEPLGLALVVLDPLFSHIDAKVRSIADADMRRNVMNPLNSAAEAAHVAILVVRHFNKDTQASALNRGAGSLGGIVGAARALWSVTVDPEDESGETKAVGVSKLNYARAPMPLRYRVVDRVPDGWIRGSVSGIEWLGSASVPIDELMRSDATLSDSAPALEEILRGGPVAASLVASQMRSRGFGRDATRSAARRLQVVKSKTAFGGGWEWTLPEQSEESDDSSEPDFSRGPRVGSQESGSDSSDASTLARARAGRAPLPDSSDSSAPGGSRRSRSGYEASEESGAGVLHAGAREGDWLHPCRRYPDHQASHRQTPDGWTCDACYPPEDPA